VKNVEDHLMKKEILRFMKESIQGKSLTNALLMDAVRNLKPMGIYLII
jgi:hypothetical protein